MDYINAFLVAGITCVIGQLILENTLLTPGHVTSLFVVLGAGLDIFGIYDRIVEFGGGGALVQITSFGHSLIHSALDHTDQYGFFGIAMKMFDLTTAGITSAIFFAFLVAILFKPKS